MEIGAWGDSITYGAGDIEVLGWVGCLRKELYEDDHEVYNRGICGDTTEDVLRRFDVEADSIDPQLVIFALGINDAKFPNRGKENKVAFAVFQENMRQLIVKAKSKTSNIIIIGLTEVDEQEAGDTSIFLNEVIRKYDAFLQELAQDEGIDYISMQEVLDVQTDVVDGLHPNSAGYGKMFQAILPTVTKWLTKV